MGLNIASMLAYMMSPFAEIVVVIANILGISSTTISLQWNGKYCLLLLVVSVIFIAGYSILI